MILSSKILSKSASQALALADFLIDLISTFRDNYEDEIIKRDKFINLTYLFLLI